MGKFNLTPNFTTKKTYQFTLYFSLSHHKVEKVIYVDN